MGASPKSLTYIEESQYSVHIEIKNKECERSWCRNITNMRVSKAALELTLGMPDKWLDLPNELELRHKLALHEY